MELLIIGGGAHAKSIIDLVRGLGGINVVGVVNNESAPGDQVLNAPVLGQLNDLPSVLARTGTRKALLAIADNGGRMNAAQRIATLVPDLEFITVVHPKAVLGSGVNMGAGSVVMAGACIEVGTTIGEHVMVGANTAIGPDTTLGNFVSIAAGASIAESCHVGSGSSIGLNAALVKRIVIGTHCVVGPGAMVLESVPDLHVATGTPARTVRTRLVGEPYL